ncbi:hypothetical protein DXB18_13275 [Clostridium sp. OM02-18AC]|uniref:hypothetical protein n=1 Tax=Clostridium sp. OM02-18AC TaxID=2292311 RepID=UPI000E4D7581|nr:hypothetical protein [Clostridium sp. OM02-18AC]RHV63853.1 hypothetical protein DXB18_13275 [Clostridium sp. OM02-18AC]
MACGSDRSSCDIWMPDRMRRESRTMRENQEKQTGRQMQKKRKQPVSQRTQTERSRKQGALKPGMQDALLEPKKGRI